MIDLSIHNFRGLSRTRLVDDRPLSLIVGMNQSGKTSLAQAIAYAFCGTVGEIKDPNLLVTQGQSDLRVRLNLPGWTLERSLARGPKLSEIATRLGNVPVKSLPLLFESGACLGYSAHLVAFLNSLDAAPADYSGMLKADPEARLLFLHALQARDGKLRSCIYYAKEQRERLSPGAKPAAPREMKPAAESLMAARAQLEMATDNYNRRLNVWRDFASRKERLVAAREWYGARELFETSAKTGRNDCLQEKRLSLERFSLLDLRPLQRAGEELKATMREDLVVPLALVLSQIEAAKEEAARTLSNHPRGSSRDAPRPLSDESLTELRRLGINSRASLEAALKDLSEEGPNHQEVAQSRMALSEAQSMVIKLERDAAIWEEYEITIEQYSLAEIERQRRWEAWNRVFHAVQTELNQTTVSARDQIERLVKKYSERLLVGADVSIDPHGRVLVQGLVPKLLSGSEFWRLGVAVMAAIASRAKAPILLLDGADILDDRNRIELVKWLLADICPNFAHTILLSTARGDYRDKAALTFNATKWWMDDGELSKL